MTSENKSKLNEQQFYELLNRYRKKIKTSALTTHDIQKFVDTSTTYQIEPERVLKHIILGNACSWGSYKNACNHHEKYFLSFKYGIFDQI